MTQHRFSGPGGTEYVPAGAGPLGRVGTANLGDGRIRVRVEPFNRQAASLMAEALAGWQQPTEENLRFSTIVREDEVEETVATAHKAVGDEAVPAATLAGAAQTARSLAEQLEALRG